MIRGAILSTRIFQLRIPRFTGCHQVAKFSTAPKDAMNKKESTGDPEIHSSEVETNLPDSRDVPANSIGLRALLKQKEGVLKEKERMVASAKLEILKCLAEVENLRGKTRRDTDSIKKHAVETFAADLLDMADNLHRTAATVPSIFQKGTLATDASANAKLLNSMLEGVNMTEKQLLKIFGQFDVRKFDPIGDQYNSNHHLIIDEVVDSSKEPHTVVSVVKSGYFIQDKLLRPAEVGIVKKPPE